MLLVVCGWSAFLSFWLFEFKNETQIKVESKKFFWSHWNYKKKQMQKLRTMELRIYAESIFLKCIKSGPSSDQTKWEFYEMHRTFFISMNTGLIF